jgi:hypothetical protein
MGRYLAAGCWGMARGQLAGGNDLHTMRAATRQPGPASCGRLARGKLASSMHGLTPGSRLRPARWKLALADDLYTMRTATRQLAFAGWYVRCSPARKTRQNAGRHPTAGYDRLRGVARGRPTGWAATLPLNLHRTSHGEPITSPVGAFHTNLRLWTEPSLS